MSRLANRLILAAEILILSALILATRCANYQDVFVGGHIYFVDADCYARMTRVRLCAQQPGLILRHHAFENFPTGTAPHTTAPLDYAILVFSLVLRPFTARPIDLAGAFISPVFAILAGIFLCGWARRVALPFRWAMLLLFALSPILVHGTSLGRPDHQSLLLLLVIIAVCADWVRPTSASIRWSIVSGGAWGFAIWVSVYEPLILFLVSAASALTGHWWWRRRSAEPSKEEIKKRSLTNRYRWVALLATLICALLIERRIPSFSIFVNDPIFHNWSRTIGELTPVPLFNAIWFAWLGWLIIAVPVLLGIGWFTGRLQHIATTPLILLTLTFCLTMWQARWAYFFAAFFVLAVPAALSSLRMRAAGWILFAVSLWPILRDWDEKIWPEETVAARQLEQRREAVELRELSLNLISGTTRPFLAPWWLSPAVTYWSGQPAVAGSSHESLSGIADSAQFYLSEDSVAAAEILQRRRVAWVVVYDADRVGKNSAMILGKAVSDRCLGRVLDRTPTRAPHFLTLFSQNGTAKLFQVTSNW